VFSAVLDTSVIFPATLNDTLLSFAQQGLYLPLWSDTILQELRDSRERAYPHRDPQALELRVSYMCQAFPSATIRGWERMAEEIAPMLPDPDDAHVIAAARTGGAELIVTDNLKDFPLEMLAPWGLSSISADKFLVKLWRSGPGAGSEALRMQSSRMLNPPLTAEEILERLARIVPEFSRTALKGFIA
jgi:predicted nucleic acid-binding protein